MKEFNQAEYTKWCAELLGFVNTTPTDKYFNIHEHPVTGEMLETNFNRRFIEDWNAIMEVVNKVLDIEDDTYRALRIYSLLSLALSKADKELVVQAIWEFLLWYNENYTQESQEEIECNTCGSPMSLLPDNSIYVCYNSECTNHYEDI